MNIKKVFDRKKELISRDPAYKEFLKTFENITDIRIFEEIDRNWRVFNWNDKIKNKHMQKYPDHWNFNQLQGKLGFKWFIHINVDWLTRKITFAPYTNHETIWIGIAPTLEGYEGVILSDPNKYPRLEWFPYPNPFNKEPILAEINEFMNPGEKGRKTWLPILIDLRRLNKSSAKQLKKYVWEIIDSKISTGQKTVPYDEYPECAFLYSLRQDSTFQKYLNWYDIHEEGKAEGWTFRRIAFGEYVRKTCPDLYNITMEKIANRTEIVHSTKGQRTLKGFIGGERIKGEDAVEKGVKLIYGAIHRKPYPSKTKQDGYNCPEHGTKCCKDCTYLLGFMKDFNKRKWMFKSVTTVSQEVLSQFPDEKSLEDSDL